MLDTDTLNYLFTLRRLGIKVGLHRTEALLAKCGNPHHAVPMIHIAGTNGKGSTAAMIASILKETGRKVGLYTSPHLVKFNERIRVNGIPIEDEPIIEFLERYRKDIDLLGSTFFETTTALTFSYFAREEVDIAVVEVGMGGRLDSSNVANPVVSVLTPIDFDHEEYLGHDLASIAREKCGILRKNVPVVVATQRDEVADVIHESVSSLGIRAHPPTPLDDIRVTPNGTHFRMGESSFKIPLLGKHQAANAQAAITACQVFDSTIPIQTVRRGLRQVTWPARLQRMSNDPLVYYDVAHNPHGLGAVLETLGELFNDISAGSICALKKSKHAGTIGRLLNGFCTHAVATAPDHKDFFSPDSLAHELSKWEIDAIPSDSISEALTYCSEPSFRCDLWLIFGTHYIAEEVFQHFDFPFDKGQI